MMTSKERLLTAIQNKKPDRLPVVTHHLMPYFLNHYYDGKSGEQFYKELGFDAIRWEMPLMGDDKAGSRYCSPLGECVGKPKVLMTDNWQVKCTEILGLPHKTFHYDIVTPKKALTMELQSNKYTTWIKDHLIKEDDDIEIIERYMPVPVCDSNTLNNIYDEFGDSGIVRAHIPGFELFGQPGCWQDACCLVGSQEMIMQTYDDSEWVHELLRILQRKKLQYISTLNGAKYDLLELGGGDASTTVISPAIFNEFVAPYDTKLIEAAHSMGQKIVYHICGGKMPILENIAAMKPDAMETFTPVEMGGDIILSEAKRRIGDKCCMIGGFDQGHRLIDCTEEETRHSVRQCFKDAGGNGGYILSPSDHFFDADVNLLRAFADEAHQCIYT